MDAIYFYDTNAILDGVAIDAIKDYFVISSVTLEELEDIKTGNRDAEVKYKARKAIHFLNENPQLYRVIVKDATIEGIISAHALPLYSHDNEICACCKAYEQENSNIVFVSNDLCCKVIAQQIFKLHVITFTELVSKSESVYTGYIDVTLSDEEMSELYRDNHILTNPYSCKNNEYLIIRKNNGEVVDTLKWNGETFNKVCSKTIRSSSFGDKIRPKDVYQAIAIDSILSNTITVLTGKAGTGKSLLSLITIMNLIESGQYDRVIIMFNPTKAKGASDMGYYSGSALEKGMQNSIGSILTTKFGDPVAVEQLLSQDKIRLISMADIRGMEVRDTEILYITETQNTSVDLIKLCLSRASSGCKIILEGDYTSQVDSYAFEGGSNGLHRVIQAFKGREEFGYVNLKNIWRSKIAELCELL